jgi:hypothetical protein
LPKTTDSHRDFNYFARRRCLTREFHTPHVALVAKSRKFARFYAVSIQKIQMRTDFPWFGFCHTFLARVFQIIKTGLPGVKFDVQSFNELCAKADIIRNHFQGVTTNCGKLQISKDITILPLRTFRKPAIEFTAGVQTAKNTAG